MSITASAPQPSLPPPQAVAAMVDGHLVIEKGDKRQTFRSDKPILLPEHSALIRSVICRDPATGLFNPKTVTIGPSGYSSVSKFINEGALVDGQYEAACEHALRTFTSKFNEGLKSIGIESPVVITHGASDIGVDRAARNTSSSLGVRQFGFNQPEWMFYVPDDQVPVYVGKDKDDYHHKFAAHSMILLLMGGRDDAAYHDRLNVQQYRNLVLPCPIMPFITPNPDPAWDIQYDRERLSADPVEWAKKVPILDASLAHLRSSPLPEIERIMEGEKSTDKLELLIEKLASIAVKHMAPRLGDARIDLSRYSL